MIEVILEDMDLDLIARHTCGGNHFQDDLSQELALYLLEMPRDKVVRMYTDLELRNYLYRAAYLMYNTKNGSFYRKYRQFIEYEPEQITEEKTEDLVREILQEAELKEMERLWIYVYLELDGNYTWIESRTGISRGCATKRIKEIINKCKKSL